MLAIWKINSFSELNLTIARIPVLFLILFKKHDELNLANFTKNRQPPNLIPCQIFCLYGIILSLIIPGLQLICSYRLTKYMHDFYYSFIHLYGYIVMYRY